MSKSISEINTTASLRVYDEDKDADDDNDDDDDDVDIIIIIIIIITIITFRAIYTTVASGI